jgi:hypothetical protein
MERMKNEKIEEASLGDTQRELLLLPGLLKPVAG